MALPGRNLVVKMSSKSVTTGFMAATSILVILLAGMFGLGQGQSALAREIETGITDNLSAELGFPVYTWSPLDTAPQAVVVAIHGATLHGRSYTTIAKQLSKKGYVVLAPDMRGYGAWYHNSEKDDELAKHVLFKQTESDILSLLKKAHQLYPGKPVFVMGESVGANMAIKLLADQADCADGIILSSPAIKQRYFFGPTVMKQLLTVFLWHPSAQLDITPFLRSRVSDDDRITDERVNDPLGRTKLNAGELFKTRWFNKDSLRLVPMLPEKLSVLVIEGSDDRLFRADLIEQDLMAQMPCSDKTLYLLKGKGHIHLETQYLKEEVEKKVAEWLAEKTSKYGQKPNGTAVSSIAPGTNASADSVSSKN